MKPSLSNEYLLHMEKHVYSTLKKKANEYLLHMEKHVYSILKKKANEYLLHMEKHVYSILKKKANEYLLHMEKHVEPTPYPPHSIDLCVVDLKIASVRMVQTTYLSLRCLR